MNCMENKPNNCYSVVPWIAFRDYVLSGETKTILYEQKSHYYYIISGKAVQIWKGITENTITDENSMSCLQLLFVDGIIEWHGERPIKVTEETTLVEKFEDVPDSINEAIKEEGYIFDAHWDVTNKCNEKCIHCYNANAHNGLRNINTDELSFEEAKALIDELCYLGVFRLVMSGGEVLTKQHFIPLCQYIRKKHIQLIIYTNALAFTESMLHDLAVLYPSNVCISVYGHTNIIHDNITQVKGSYDKVVFALSYFKKYGIETSHKNTLLTRNYQYWQETLQKGKQLASISLVNFTIYPSLDGDGLTPYRLDESQLVEVAKSPDSPIYFKRKIHGACNIFKPKDETPCYNKTNTIYINPRGEVCICIAYPSIIASLREGNIRELKRNSHQSNFEVDSSSLKGYDRLDNWRSLKISDLKECGQYDYCEFCIDVCPGDALLLSGDLLNAPENHCIIAKARYKAYLSDNNTDSKL